MPERQNSYKPNLTGECVLGAVEIKAKHKRHCCQRDDAQEANELKVHYLDLVLGGLVGNPLFVPLKIQILIILAASSLSAQTNVHYATNWVTAPLTFRIVDGQVYDTARSSKWISLNIPSEFSPYGLRSDAWPFPGKVLEMTFSPAVPEGKSSKDVDMITVRNLTYRTQDFVVSYNRRYTRKELKLARVLALRVLPVSAVTNWGMNGAIRSIHRTYDCGRPCTDKIPVVTVKK